MTGDADETGDRAGGAWSRFWRLVFAELDGGRVRPFARAGLRAACRDVAESRPADVVIGGRADPYLSRWHLVPRNELGNLYFHRFHRDDDDRALHDHPWDSLSLVLSCGYDEEIPADPDEPAGARSRIPRRPGDVIWRPARAPHRVVLHRDLYEAPRAAETLFVTGPRFVGSGVMPTGGGPT